jgi:hypothetical protein
MYLTLILMNILHNLPLQNRCCFQIRYLNCVNWNNKRICVYVMTTTLHSLCKLCVLFWTRDDEWWFLAWALMRLYSMCCQLIMSKSTMFASAGLLVTIRAPCKWYVSWVTTIFARWVLHLQECHRAMFIAVHEIAYRFVSFFAIGKWA